MIRILSDSTCDLSKELIDRYQIGIIPLHIVMDQKEYLDGLEITPDEIYSWADAQKKTPKTSAVSLEEATAAFRDVLSAGDDAVVFTISSSMSSTYDVFCLAVKNLEAEERIRIIDSANLSTGIGLLVIEAACMVQQGLSLPEICEKIEELKPRVQASFVVSTLVYLYRGGRCSSVAALAGSVLKLHPEIEVRDGAMLATRKFRGSMNSVLQKYFEALKETMMHAKPERVFVTHSGELDRQTVDLLKEELKGLDHFGEILETRAGGVVSSHCGPGTLGILFIE
jgi:DegV family protein with EDD domain